MKKIIFSVVASMMLLCACDSTTKDNEDINNTIDNQQETASVEITTSKSDAMNQGIQTAVGAFGIKRDADTGEVKFGSLPASRKIVYKGEELELGIRMFIKVPVLKDEVVQIVAMMMVDGQLVPYSIEGGEKSLTHILKVDNGGEHDTIVNFSADMLDINEESEWVFIGIPVLVDYGHTVNQRTILWCSEKITSTEEKTNSEEYIYCSDGYFYDTTMNVYGKKLHDICPYNGAISDYILQDKDGNWNYMSERVDGKSIVYLFCDGKLYDGFDGKYGLIIDKADNGPVHKHIDVSEIPAGKHEVYAVVVKYSKFGVIKEVVKSLISEVNILE